MVARQKPSIGAPWIARIAAGAFLRWRVALTAAIRSVSDVGAAIGSSIWQAWDAMRSLAARALKRAFARWRAAVTLIVVRTVAALRRFRVDGVARATRAWARPSAAPKIDSRDLPAAVVAAICLIAAAAVLAAVAGLRTGAAVWSYGASVVVWSAARLAVLRASASSARIDATAASTSWAVSLPPFALAAVPGLGLAAFALSAVLAYRALVSFGTPRRDALRVAAWTYGAHAAGVVAATIASAVLGG